ncbi:hypothetical protein Dsin_023425 [Dipteronia sinensis]|uniref:RNase H type-1 domain-containing protein n=1 Tax=Dipteronia sinensis TaxID=43782 RepID=A0AAE0A3B5_9ROSI|nr:hypothetical protein Dsin_023425 [Dipteronia sinensis]
MFKIYTVMSCMDEIYGCCPDAKYGRVWSTLFNAVVWTIWEARNKVVFRNEPVEIDFFVDLVRFRVAWWFKHHGRGSTVPITILIENVGIACIDIKSVNSFKAADSVNKKVWSPPEKGALKFNVDGAATKGPNRAGIGGVLCNFKVVVLCSFSDYVGPCDASTVEMMAIHKACSLCVARGVFIGKKIDFISDSREAVSRVNNEGLGNFNQLHLIYDIRSMLGLLGKASLSFNPRVTNHEADLMAKQGLSSDREIVVWHDV